MLISYLSSDVCSSDLDQHDLGAAAVDRLRAAAHRHRAALPAVRRRPAVPGNRQGNALRPRAGLAPMSPLALGVLIGVVTIAVLATGIPIAFGLGLVALGFLIAVDGWDSLSIVADTFFAGLAEFGLVAIPMFVIMGAAVAS